MSKRRSRSRVRRRSRSLARKGHNRSYIQEVIDTNVTCNNSTVLTNAIRSEIQEQLDKQKSVKISCQLAHGSPTAIISDYTSMLELFEKIADAFDISQDDIIFCTVNTFKPNMEFLFNGTMMSDDLLFVHIAGQPYEIEVIKTQKSLGVTIADNGLCRCFIKHIAKYSTLDKLRPNVSVGQLIEKINGVDVIGLRHFEVARMFRQIPLDTRFTMRLISPIQYQIGFLQPRSIFNGGKTIRGTETIRIKPGGGLVIEKIGVNDGWIAKINELLEGYIGIHDNQLALSLLEVTQRSKNVFDLTDELKKTDLAPFDFPEKFIFEVWNTYQQSKLKEDVELMS